MAEQIRKTAPSNQPAQGENASGRLKERGEKLSKHIDAVRNDIDDVLGENAEEFVRNYIQRGGK